MLEPASIECTWELIHTSPLSSDWIGLFIHNREFKWSDYVSTGSISVCSLLILKGAELQEGQLSVG